MNDVTRKEKPLLDTFPFVFSDKSLKESFCNVHIKGLDILTQSKRMRLYLLCKHLIPVSHLRRLQTEMTRSFSLEAEIHPEFQLDLSTEELIKEYWDSIIYYVCNEYPSAKGIIKDATYEVNGSNLYINLPVAGKMILESNGCRNAMEELLSNYFIRRIKVSINEPRMTEKKKIEYIQAKDELEYSMVQELVQAPAEVISKKPEKQEGAREAFVADDPVILGKNFQDEIVPMSEVTIDSGRICVKGEIISVDRRILKSGKTLFIFDVTDLTGSITIKLFSNDKNFEGLKESIKTGIYIKIRGDAQYDSFAKELTIQARDIVKASRRIRMDNAKKKRIELHLHTQMSQMDAITNVKELVARAAQWGHPAIAITDHGVVQAYPDAYAVSKKTGIKIIYGVECYLLGEQKLDSDGSIDFKNTNVYHAIILVKNQVGLKNLYKIISESHLNYFYKRPRVPKQLLEKYREGLILGSACEAGELYRAVMENKSEEEIQRVALYYDYLEIQPLGNNQFMIDNGMVDGYEQLMEANRYIISLGEKLDRPVVATCDVHFMDPEDEVYRRLLQSGQGYKDADRQAPLFLRTTAEMLEEFKYLGEEKAYEVVVTNTHLINDWVEDLKPIPDGTFPPFIDGAERDIKNIAESKAKELYGEPLPGIVRERLDKELNSIIKNGFSVMYIIAQKLVWKSVEDGYLVGSRGSVGSSFVANMTGITEVNSLPAHYRCEKCFYSEFHEKNLDINCGFDLPDKKCPKCGQPLKKDGYDIPFETFLGFDGDKEPDIDLNFSGEYQSNAHKYTETLFGEGHVFRAGTIATIADKTAFGFVKGYLNERNKIVTNAEVNRLVQGCTGIKRTTGQHPGGVMVVPHDKEIYDFCPVQRPADDPKSSTITTHFDYHSISGRILKLDILGHDDPTVIRMLQDITGIDPQGIPIGEKRTMGLFSSTEPLGINPEEINSEVGTFGVPEFGTKFVRQMLVDTKPTTFAELIRISGLSHGTDVWLNNAQELVRKGIAALPNVISTRDDIMIYLMKNDLPPLTSFKIMEDVRKGKGLKPEYEELMRDKKVPGWYIESCKKIKYMFPKAHAAAYVMMAFRIAWFKVYHPEAFYVAYFTVRADEFDSDIISKGKDRVKNKIKELENKGKDATQKEKNLLTILEVANEMYARGIKCLPVDLYKSEASDFRITPEGILPPFNALQGLGDAAARNLVEARKKGRFLSIDDLKIKAGISKSVIEIMENHGCLKGLADTNQVCFF